MDHERSTTVSVGGDRVIVRVPATVESAALLRLTAAQLAVTSGFDVDRIEDVRMAVHATTRALTGSPDPDAGIGSSAAVEATFEVSDGRLDACLRGVGGPLCPPSDADRVTRVLDATATTHRVVRTELDGDTVALHFDTEAP